MVDQYKDNTEKLNRIVSSMAQSLKDCGLIGSKEVLDRSKMNVNQLEFMAAIDKIAAGFHSLSPVEIEIIETIGKRL